MNILQIFLVHLLLLISLAVQAVEIQVSVDRNPVNINDSFQIIFSASQEPDGNPDFSELQNNFEIVNQQRSSNASWVNGHSSRTEQWIVSVIAKQAGELLIPPVAFGSDSSNALKITVNEIQASPQSNEDLFLDVSATPEKPFVQSQVIYTLRLYRRLQITQARLEEPQIKDAVVEKLGEDNTYTTPVNGVNYWVTERKYAIFPQHSGTLTIPALTLNAEVLVQRAPRFNGFFNQQTTENRRVASKAITLTVLAVPPSFKNSTWISAESVELTETWSDNSLETKVGEPLTRTLKLVAKGSTVGQLPELSSADSIDGIKTYPDQPVLKEDKQADGLTAVREEKIAFIPSKPGSYKLPAIAISWFNTKTQKIQKVSLPSVTLKALGNSNTSNQSQPTLATEEDSSANTKLASPLVTNTDESRLWQGVSAFLALGWLVTLILFFKKKTHTVVAHKEKTNKVDSSADTAIEKALKHACWENNPQAAKQALLQWGKAQFRVDSLGMIAKHCEAALHDEIILLNQHLYSGQAETWKGDALWQAFGKNNAIPSVKIAKGEGLEPLFRF